MYQFYIFVFFSAGALPGCNVCAFDTETFTPPESSEEFLVQITRGDYAELMGLMVKSLENAKVSYFKNLYLYTFIIYFLSFIFFFFFHFCFFFFYIVLQFCFFFFFFTVLILFFLHRSLFCFFFDVLHFCFFSSFFSLFFTF